MWPYQAPQYNPMQPQGNPYLAMAQQQQMPQTQVVRVNGRPGAEAYRMGPNSSALLLDESGTIVWVVTTDGASYKTVTPYDISPHQDAPVPDVSSFEARLKRLEEIVHGTSGNTTADRDVEPDDRPA